MSKAIGRHRRGLDEQLLQLARSLQHAQQTRVVDGGQIPLALHSVSNANGCFREREPQRAQLRPARHAGVGSGERPSEISAPHAARVVEARQREGAEQRKRMLQRLDLKKDLAAR